MKLNHLNLFFIFNYVLRNLIFELVSGFREYKVGPVTHEAFGAHEGEGEGEVAQSCPTL